MISGFNIDIEHNGTVYPVQPAENGRANPVIESLVYVGGQVVVSERDDYTDLLDRNATDEEIASRVRQQHKELITAIENGRFDDHLVLVLEPNGDVRVGRRVLLALRVSSGLTGDQVSEAPVMVQLLSPLCEQAVLGKGLTDAAGKCVMTVRIPALQEGMAVLIISAASPIGGAEVKHLL